LQFPQIPGLKKFSSAWAFPCCGCGCLGLVIIILVMAFSATFSRHVGEQSPLAGPISMVCADSFEGHTLDEVVIINNQAKVSWFGRPDSPNYCRDPDDNIYGAYVGEKPDGCNLNDPDDYYAAVYDPQHPPRNWWGKKQLLVKYKDKSVVVTIVDHGPHPSTGRQLDLSYAAFKSLGVSTDSVVEVCFPGSTFAGAGDVVSIALSQEGRCYNNDYTPYNNHNGNQWCAAFVSWVYNQAGYKVPFIEGSRRLFEWFRDNKHQTFPDPRLAAPGDIVVWKRSKDYQGHVGIVIANDGKTITTLEGNSSRNCVKRRRYSYYKILNNHAGLYGFARW